MLIECDRYGVPLEQSIVFVTESNTPKNVPRNM